MNQLLKLYFARRRRTFKWKDVFIFLYIVLLIAIIGFITFDEIKEQIYQQIKHFVVDEFIIALAVLFITPDFILKIMFKHDNGRMDDFIKSKPVKMSVWSRFVFLINSINFWNLLLPFILSPFWFLTMPIGKAILSNLLFYTVSFLNGILITSLRTTDRWIYRLPLLIGWSFYLLGSAFYSLNIFCWSMLTSISVYILINVLFTFLIGYYMSLIQCYSEHTSRNLSINAIIPESIFFSEFVKIIRSKRLRFPFLFISAFYIFESYSFSFWSEFGNDLVGIWFMIGMTIPFILGQYGLGIEANYFQGIWTKPYPISDILKKKFYFYLFLNSIVATLLLPLVLKNIISLSLFMTAFVYTSGFINTAMLPINLISVRLNIDDSSVFNFQGFSRNMYIYTIFLISFSSIFFFITLHFLDLITAQIILLFIGLAAFTLHRLIIKIISTEFIKRRYVIMERFME